MTTLVRQKSQSKAFRSHGVSLIEVMVTLVVVSVGVLGFASLQGQTQMAELQAAEYAYASRMVNSMAEHLRADADYGLRRFQNLL
jgi:type IV pilus assembly protein PilV